MPLQMPAIPEELTSLVSDLETFLHDGLKGENLSKKAKEKKEAFIKRIKEVKLGFPQDFKDKSADDSRDEEEEADSINDGGSLHSERTDKDEESCDGAQQAPPVAAQDLPSVFKAGYLEKRRKDHSFFGTEWQKRWCALSGDMFYYYGSEKDKQQKGEFGIDGYSVKMNSTLRKDAKKDFCFEICAQDKRVYQFCASSLKEAEDWVKQIDFVLRDMSGVIPEEEEDQEMYDDVGPTVPPPNSAKPEPIDDDIYEELPEEDMPAPPKPPLKVETPSKPVPAPTALNANELLLPTTHSGYMLDGGGGEMASVIHVDQSTDYQNFYQGLWDCSGDQPDELSFKRGDAIYILSKEYQSFGWWVGELKGNIGIIPKDYLTELYAI